MNDTTYNPNTVVVGKTKEVDYSGRNPVAIHSLMGPMAPDHENASPGDPRFSCPDCGGVLNLVDRESGRYFAHKECNDICLPMEYFGPAGSAEKFSPETLIHDQLADIIADVYAEQLGWVRQASNKYYLPHSPRSVIYADAVMTCPVQGITAYVEVVDTHNLTEGATKRELAKERLVAAIDDPSIWVYLCYMGRGKKGAKLYAKVVEGEDVSAILPNYVTEYATLATSRRAA